MRLRRVKVRNFRCYSNEICVDVDDFTALIGKNDAGKSTILEALAIFFEEQKPDQHDAAKHGDPADMAITCEFDDVPESLVLDATNRTSLADEHLLNEQGRLAICRIFNGSLKTPTAKTYIIAAHPTVEGAADLLSLKLPELKARARELEVDLSGANQRISASMRAAIREHVQDLQLAERAIEVDTQPGAKELYGRIKEALPVYFLFKADRPSTDQDSEAQDPMRIAVRLAIEQQKNALDHIALTVRQQVAELVDQTLAKVASMAPEVAAELAPDISEPKWDSIFKITLASDSTIPLNKRGSGIRRLVLLGFLQAQAESLRLLNPDSRIIYAIEEPETSQHPDKQRALMQALQEIAEQANYQVLVTTHNPMLGRLLPVEAIRYIESSGQMRVAHPPGDDTARMVASALGVLPDHDVRVFVGIEGKHDEAFLKALSETLSETDDQIANLADLELQGRLVFIPVGGSNIGLWVSRLQGLNRPEFHIFDRDNPPPAEAHYASQANAINARLGCVAVHTSKRELENYLHPRAVSAARPEVVLPRIEDFDDVPELAAQQIHATGGSDALWVELDEKRRGKKVSRAKQWLNREAASAMTKDLLSESDPGGEVVGWLREITRLASE